MDFDIYILWFTGSVVASDTAAGRRTSTTAVAGLCRRVL